MRPMWGKPMVIDGCSCVAIGDEVAHSRRRWGRLLKMIVAAIGLLALLLGRLDVVPAGASGPPTKALTVCDEPHLLSAISSVETQGGTVQFECSGDIGLSAPISVTTGDNFVLDASTAPSPGVILDGQGDTQIFDVEGGQLNLIDLSVENGAVTGTTGATGTDGAQGIFATDCYDDPDLCPGGAHGVNGMTAGQGGAARPAGGGGGRA